MNQDKLRRYKVGKFVIEVWVDKIAYRGGCAGCNIDSIFMSSAVFYHSPITGARIIRLCKKCSEKNRLLEGRKIMPKGIVLLRMKGLI